MSALGQTLYGTPAPGQGALGYSHVPVFGYAPGADAVPGRGGFPTAAPQGPIISGVCTPGGGGGG
jgi:hypothetical protein